MGYLMLTCSYAVYVEDGTTASGLPVVFLENFMIFISPHM